MFAFKEDSPIVRIWINRLLDKISTKEDVPNLFNLRDLVYKGYDYQTKERDEK